MSASPGTRWIRQKITQPLDTRFFSVTPTAGDALPQLDGLRAIAVIVIFMRHSWGLSGSWRPVWRWGVDIDFTPFVVMMANGVDLFFVLSGFLLSRQFIKAHELRKHRPDLRRYFRLRTFRILPAYYVSLAAAVLVFTPVVIEPGLVYSWLGLKTIISKIFVVQTMSPWAYGLWSATSPYWTLTIEVLFYIMLPFVIRFFLGRRWLIAVPLTLLITWGWLYFARSRFSDPLTDLIVDRGGRPGASPAFAHFFLSKQLPAHLFDFACGIGAACAIAALKNYRGSLERLGRVARAAGIALTVAGMYWLGRLTQDNTFYDGVVLMSTSNASARTFYYLEEPLMGLGFGVLIFGLCCTGTRGGLLSWKPLRFIGIIGFGIYLWHMPFLYMNAKLPWIAGISDLKTHWITLMLFTGAVVVTVAAVTYVGIEKPFIDRARRRRPVAQAVPDAVPLEPNGRVPSAEVLVSGSAAP